MGLALMAAMFMAALGQLWLPLENRWLDWEQRFLATQPDVSAPGPVVVVGLDDASLAQFGVPLATLHRQVGGFFEAMALARPKAVGVDVVLPQTSYDRIQPGLDAALARGILSLRKIAPVVLGVTATNDGSLRLPHPLFANLVGQEGLALVFVPRDTDGVVRRFMVQVTDGEPAINVLVGQLAKRLGIPLQDGLVPYFRGQRFDYIPLKDVLSWREAGDTARLAAAFGGKVVFLGSLLAQDDLHRVPIPLAVNDVADTTHGVFLHAAQMSALMGEGLVKPMPLGIAILIAVLMASSWWLPSGRIVWIVGAVVAGGILVLSLRMLVSGVAIPAITWIMSLAFGIGGRTLLTAWFAAAERRRLRQAFDGLVSPGVLTEILAGRLYPALKGERRDVCVLFSDIRGFTTLSEHMSPESVTSLLNRYFERMAMAIHHHGGTLDKFIGDGIMAFFGAPQASDRACDEAFAAAREMLEHLDEFNREQEAAGDPCIAIGIGLHYGPALIGYIGATSRHEYSAIGDTVNTASRLEGVTKDAGFPVVMSPVVEAKLMDKQAVIAIGEFPLKGRAPLELYGWKPERMQ